MPEAQLDRFLLRTSLGYPSLDEEIRILDDQVHGHPLETARPGHRPPDELETLFAAVEDVYVDPLAQALDRRARAGDPRAAEMLEVGASVRGTSRSSGLRAR